MRCFDHEEKSKYNSRETVTITAGMVSKGQVAVNWDTAKTYQWWRILMTAASHPDGYIRIGRVYVGSFDEPSRNYGREWDEDRMAYSEVLANAAGQKYVNKQGQAKRFSLNFPSFTAADADLFNALAIALGVDEAFFVCLNPADLVAQTYYVSCTSGWKLRHIRDGELYSTSLMLEEET